MNLTVGGVEFMTYVPQELEKFCITSINQSDPSETSWRLTETHFIDLFAKKNMIIYVIARIFGKDEIWTISSYRTVESLRALRYEPSINYVAPLTHVLPLNEDLMKEIRAKKLPKAYIFIRTEELTLEDLSHFVTDSGGSPFLLGIINHPNGYNYFVALTTKTGRISDLNQTIHTIASKTSCEKWESWLGADHWWPREKTMKTKIKEKEKKATPDGPVEFWKRMEQYKYETDEYDMNQRSGLV
jgi:hypothetical protein